MRQVPRWWEMKNRFEDLDHWYSSFPCTLAGCFCCQCCSSNDGVGTVAVTSSTPISHQVFDEGELALVMVNNTFSVTGTMSGHAWAIERDLNHTDTGRITLRGLAHFTGSVNEMSGTLLIRYGGVNNGTFITGHFVIGDGTGGLAGVHGRGSFEGKVTAPLSYTLSWNVQADHTEREDDTQTKETD